MDALRRLLIVMLLLTALLPSRVAAETPMSGRPPQSATPVADALSREAMRVALMPTNTIASRGQAQTPPRRSFLKRHPVWSGLLIGAGAGTAIAAGAWGNEGAFVGFYGGAAAGATTGWLLSR
ncbi:MAG TPA: hypothetical protein VMF13_07715 [Luteitalea sp.]|nr:hypothetical protein [Luteitalea sp.]